jgi:hypothetical protein
MKLENVTVVSNNVHNTFANIGDTVTVFFTLDQEIKIAPVVTIAGRPAIVAGTGKSWNAKIVLDKGDKTGIISFTINIVDDTGKIILESSVITSGEYVTFKKTSILVAVIKKIIVITICILIIAFLSSVYTFIRNGQVPKVSEEQKKIDKDVYLKDVAAQKIFIENSTSENQDEYIKSVTKTLNETSLSPYATNLLRLRKAIVLSTLKGGPNQDAYATEATSIFKDLILTKKTDSNSIYLKDFAIVAGVKLHNQCCFTSSLAGKEFGNYSKYKKMGYPEDVVNLLTLNDISKMVSKERTDDISNISNKFSIEVDLLMKNRKSLSNETYKQIYNELGENLNAYKSAKSILFTDPANTILRPTTHYAVAYDVYYSQSSSKLTTEDNKKIDANYEFALNKIKTAESIAKNNPLINEMKVYLLIGYINSLEQRYGSSVDENKRSHLVDEILKSIRSTKETESLFGGVFKQSVQSPDFKTSVAYNFFALYKYYPELDAYLNSLDIKRGGIK